MPHDKNGQILSIGDVVIVEAVITHVQTGEEYCNLSLDTVEPMYPEQSKSSMSLNAKQVTKKPTDA